MSLTRPFNVQCLNTSKVSLPRHVTLHVRLAIVLGAQHHHLPCHNWFWRWVVWSLNVNQSKNKSDSCQLHWPQKIKHPWLNPSWKHSIHSHTTHQPALFLPQPPLLSICCNLGTLRFARLVTNGRPPTTGEFSQIWAIKNDPSPRNVDS